MPGVSTLPRIDTTPIDVLLSMEAALRKGCNLSDDMCYLSCEPDEGIPAPAPGDVFIVIEPDGMDFDEGLFIGGGQFEIAVDTGVMLHLYSTIRIDSNAKRQRTLLTDGQRGLYALMATIMSSLAGGDLLVNNGQNCCLTELLHPIMASSPEKINNNLVHLGFAWALQYLWANAQEG